jgi:hypothetical protein
MGLSTDDVMQTSLDLVGWDEVPGDSTVYVPGEDLETALVGIDLESPEVQLAHREEYDLALAHHPVGGAARLAFTDVLARQAEFMTSHGVPEDRAEDVVGDMRSRLDHSAHASNYRHDPSVAELLEQPYMNVHLAPDELGRRAFEEVVDDVGPGATVADLKTAFEERFPAFAAADTDVVARLGSMDDELGEVAVHHAAGTNGGADVARAYFDAGVDTVLYIHVGGGDTAELREEYGDGDETLVITGHIASDAVGLNTYIDALEERGLDCTTISGCGLGR